MSELESIHFCSLLLEKYFLPICLFPCFTLLNIYCMQGISTSMLKENKNVQTPNKPHFHKLKLNTYCVITSIGVKFVVHCFNNTSSEGQKKKFNASFHSNTYNFFYLFLNEPSVTIPLSSILITKLTYLLASSPPGGRLGMLSDANVRITWTKSGTPSSPCFLMISVRKYNLIRF